jgi:thiol-disulfide isomerase/thioredoxin
MFTELPEKKTHDKNVNLEILFFTSQKCGPCHIVEKNLMETLVKKNLSIKVTKIDVEKNPELAEKYDVIVCPTLIFHNFMKVDGGCHQDELEEIISWYFTKSFEL